MSGLSRIGTKYQELFVFDWQFRLGDMTPEEACAGKDGWNDVELPHDWSREYPYDKEAPCGGTGGYVKTGIGWYRKVFHVPESSRGKRLYVLFDGVYMDSSVYINGRLAGRHYYGYTPFELDISGLLSFGGDNVITVRVNNADQPNSRWYTGSGIIRDVWMKTLDPVHIAGYCTQVIVDNVTEITARVTVKSTVENSCELERRIIIRTTVYDADGKAVTDYGAQQGVLLQPGKNEVQQTLGVDMPHMWSVESPYLYSAVVRLIVDGMIVDEYKTRFGIRTLFYSPRKGLVLNGSHVKVIGGAVHQDGGGVGAAVPKKVWDRRLKLLKQTGLNAVRTAHNPPDEYLLEACDEQGFLVMDEVFDEWRVIKETKSQMNPAIIDRGYGERFDECFEADIEVFLRRDRNHPSIIMWSAGNEVPDQTKPFGAELLRRMKDICHAMDDRPVTVGCDFIAAEPLPATDEFLGELDIVGYNYVNRWRSRAETNYFDDKLTHPGRLQVGTENGGVRAVPRGRYLLDYPAGAGYTREMPYNMLAADASALFRYTMTRDYVIGDYMWTLIDYLGEARWPGRSSRAGIMDTCGFPKDNYYFYKCMLNRAEPTLHIMPHWNIEAKEGRIIPVLCYSSVPEVELFVNGKSYGRKCYAFPRYGMQYKYSYYPNRIIATTNDLWLSWDVAFERGVVEAVGYENGVEVIRKKIVTTGKAAAVRALPDGMTLKADGRDIAQIEVSLHDRQGYEVPDGDDELTVNVSGAGSLRALDNGDFQCKTPFTGRSMKAAGGKLLITVQAAKEAGTLRVDIAGAHLEGTAVELQVE